MKCELKNIDELNAENVMIYIKAETEIEAYALAKFAKDNIVVVNDVGAFKNIVIDAGIKK